MTVNQLRRKLEQLRDRGYGETPVVIADPEEGYEDTVGIEIRSEEEVDGDYHSPGPVIEIY